jgi:hypothetical protein
LGDISDDIHAALVAEAKVRGVSLGEYLRVELERLVGRSQEGASGKIIREGRARVEPVRATREEVLDVIRAGRGEGMDSLR